MALGKSLTKACRDQTLICDIERYLERFENTPFREQEPDWTEILVRAYMYQSSIIEISEKSNKVDRKARGKSG